MRESNPPNPQLRMLKKIVRARVKELSGKTSKYED